MFYALSTAYLSRGNLLYSPTVSDTHSAWHRIVGPAWQDKSLVYFVTRLLRYGGAEMWTRMWVTISIGKLTPLTPSSGHSTSTCPP